MKRPRSSPSSRKRFTGKSIHMSKYRSHILIVVASPSLQDKMMEEFEHEAEMEKLTKSTTSDSFESVDSSKEE